MHDDIAIKVHNLHKSFDMAENKSTSIKQLLVNAGKKNKKHRQKVLDGIDFEVKKGEFFGIVGRNGSGKSTLLKILAGVYTPDSGAVEVNGNLTPFIELGVGFNPELTGRDNVYLSASLLGFTRAQTAEMYDDIVSFAELGEHMNKKLKNYSSGMQVRLAFSIAIYGKNDILIFDEVLAVGDSNFQEKCFRYFTELKERKQTVIFVSHDQNAVETYCTRALLLEAGKIIHTGKPKEVFHKYRQLISMENPGNEPSIKAKSTEHLERKTTGRVKIVSTSFTDNKGVNKALFFEDEKVNILVKFKVIEKIDEPIYGLIIRKVGEDKPITATNTREAGFMTKTRVPNDEFVVTFTYDNVFGDGEYLVTPGCASSRSVNIFHDWVTDAASFSIKGRQDKFRMLYLKHDIKEGK